MNIQLNTCIRRDHDHQNDDFEKFIYGLSLHVMHMLDCYIIIGRICKLQNILIRTRV